MSKALNVYLDAKRLPRAAVGQFHSPKTGAQVYVYAKRGESKQRAIARVKRSHGA